VPFYRDRDRRTPCYGWIALASEHAFKKLDARSVSSPKVVKRGPACFRSPWSMTGSSNNDFSLLSMIRKNLRTANAWRRVSKIKVHQNVKVYNTILFSTFCLPWAHTYSGFGHSLVINVNPTVHTDACRTSAPDIEESGVGTDFGNIQGVRCPGNTAIGRWKWSDVYRNDCTLKALE
jgi:hypothetical protein